MSDVTPTATPPASTPTPQAASAALAAAGMIPVGVPGAPDQTPPASPAADPAPVDPAPTDAASADPAPVDPDPAELSEEEILAKANNPDAVKKALDDQRRIARDAKATAAALEQQLRERDLPLEQKVEAAETRAKEEALRALRYEVASEAGLDLGLAPRLVGASRDELLADAQSFKERLGTQPAAPAVAPEGGMTPPPAQPNPVASHDNFLLGALQAHQGARTGAAFSGLEPAPRD